MEFKNLDSQETLTAGLQWVAECIQDSIESGNNDVKFTFTPSEENSIDKIFEFSQKLGSQLYSYGMMTWCILDNKNKVVRMKIVLGR